MQVHAGGTLKWNRSQSDEEASLRLTLIPATRRWGGLPATRRCQHCTIHPCLYVCVEVSYSCAVQSADSFHVHWRSGGEPCRYSLVPPASLRACERLFCVSEARLAFSVVVW